MLTTPWSSHSKALTNRDYLVILSYLPLKHDRKIPAFMWYVLLIQRQLKATERLIGYALSAKPLHHQYWTLSAWQDTAALSAFVHTKPHRRVMAALQGHMAPTTFINVVGKRCRSSADIARSHKEASRRERCKKWIST